MEVTPYKNTEASKKDQVADMFDSIAHKYDFLNHFFSLGIDKLWRKRTIKMLSKFQPKEMLDIATGTGDFAFEAMKLNPNKVIGVDISKGMLENGNVKVKKRGLEDRITLTYGDSENLQFENDVFDAITVGFGVRNFQNLEKGLAEIYRVTKPGGHAAILEFSQPERFPIKQLYNFHFNYIMPAIGKLVSKDSRAYSYLHESVSVFPYGRKFADILESTGFKNTKIRKVSAGIASIYLAEK